jgi:hypothetical protein
MTWAVSFGAALRLGIMLAESAPTPHFASKSITSMFKSSHVTNEVRGQISNRQLTQETDSSAPGASSSRGAPNSAHPMH